MNKDVILGVRVTLAEHRAVKRFAKAHSQTVADLIRGRVINPALAHDPKQAEMVLRAEDDSADILALRLRTAEKHRRAGHSVRSDVEIIRLHGQERGAAMRAR